jgi:hypothetical protein
VCLLQTERGSRLRPGGDVTEAKRNKAAVDEVMELR